MAFSLAMPWNEGEEQMHRLLRVPEHDNPTSSMLTPQASFMLQRAPTLAIGTLDDHKRPWTSLWGGDVGFSEPLGGGLVGTRTLVDANDPVVQALKFEKDKMSRIQGGGKLVSGLAIDLMSRKRVKVAGKVVAGTLRDVEAEDKDGTKQKQDEIQVVTQIDQSLGNCPKYLNQYEIRPALIKSQVTSTGPALSEAGQKLISNCDLFFLSSSTDHDMDTNHRGGPVGFVRIVSPNQIAYPEYSGNRLYQSLGNLKINPRIGLVFPNLETGDVLYITGSADILVGSEAGTLLPGSNLAVLITIGDTRLVERGLPFRGTHKTSSPYNPLVRTLASEGNLKATIQDHAKTAQLVSKTLITPSIARFTFEIPEGIEYEPSQWVALDFKDELDTGYEHMRDDDPTSLNDDFVRTFTISSTPTAAQAKQKSFDITIRNVGRATSHLFRQNAKAGFEIRVLGVGGGLPFPQKEEKGLVPFIAGGIGITPLLGQLTSIDLRPERFRLLWTGRADDVELMAELMKKHQELIPSTTVFLTGDAEHGNVAQVIGELESMGVDVKKRRLAKEDVDKVQTRTWYLCAGQALRKVIFSWLDGKEVLFENFDY